MKSYFDWFVFVLANDFSIDTDETRGNAFRQGDQ